MAATDYQSLASTVRHDQSAGMVTMSQLLRIALLKLIANTVAPTVQTDPQSLMNAANVSGYNAAGMVSMGELLELALLQIIAQNIGSTSGASVTSGSGAPSGTAVTGSLYINTTDNTLWDYNGGWNMLV